MKTKKKAYVPLEVTMLAENNVCSLIARHKMKGLGCYLAMLLELRNNPNYCMNNAALKLINRKYGIGKSTAESILNDFGLFHILTDGNERLITSLYLREVMRKYDEKILKCKEAGTKSGLVRNATKNEGAFNSVATTEQNKTEQNNNSNINNNNITDNYLNILLQQAFNNKTWLEQLLMKARISPSQPDAIPHLITLLERHITLYNKQNETKSVDELRRYIANILSPGKISHTDITRQLDQLQQKASQANPYRYETIDPATGQRMVQGKIIPADAPPRPDENKYWSRELQSWV